MVFEAVVRTSQLQQILFEGDCLIEKVKTDTIGTIMLALFRVVVVVRAPVVFVNVVSLDEDCFDRTRYPVGEFLNYAVRAVLGRKMRFQLCQVGARPEWHPRVHGRYYFLLESFDAPIFPQNAEDCATVAQFLAELNDYSTPSTISKKARQIVSAPACPKKVESGLGPVWAEYRAKQACVTQNKTKWANKMMFLFLVRDQDLDLDDWLGAWQGPLVAPPCLAVEYD